MRWNVSVPMVIVAFVGELSHGDALPWACDSCVDAKVLFSLNVLLWFLFAD